MRHIILITLIILSFSIVCVAQDSQRNELRFNHLFVEDGLPEGQVRALMQDKQGYVWIGTQNGLVRFDGYKTKVYKFESNNVYHIFIHSIFEDRKGELWVGTWGVGFYSYDRANDSFILFKPGLENVSSLTSGEIRSLYDDQYGNIWMVEYRYDKNKGYIHSFDPKTKMFKHYSNEEKGPHNINAATVNDFFEDKKGRLWIGSDNGLYQYDHKEDKFIAHLTNEDHSQQKDFRRFQHDASNPDIIWVNAWNNSSHKDELWRYNTKDYSVKKFVHNPKDPGGLGGDTIWVVHRDAKGRIWAGTNNGLSVFDPATEHFINYSPQDGKKNLNANIIYEIREDRNGNFWCASGYGLVIFESNRGKFIRYTANEKYTDINALANNDVHNLLIDRAGTLWFGSSNIGLQWINKALSKYILYKNTPGQPHYFPERSAYCFAEAPDSTFYIGTDHELYYWQPRTDSFKQTKLSKYRDKDMLVWSVIADRQGLIWCGGYRDNQGVGLFCYDPVTGKTKQFIHNEKDSTSLSNNSVSYILEGHSGILWIGTWGGGLCRFNKTSQTFARYPYIVNKFNTPNNSALDDAQVTNICEDKNGVIWVGTNIGALNELNRQSGRFTSYQNQLPGFFSVINIFEDAKGGLWAGTHLSGIFHLDRKTKKIKKISEKDGLLHDASRQILEDNKGNLWIGSERGISILNPATNKIRTLTKSNGLLGEQLSESLNTAIKTKKGSFLIACKNGFISLNPDDFTADTNAPVVHIETIDFTNPKTTDKKEKDSSVYAYGKSRMELNYNQNKVSFHYVGLQYQNAELTQYAYKLDGYDKDWIQAGTQRAVTYTNLFPGTYTFRVKAANSDGVWSDQEDTITIIISTPWWKTWWAYTFYFIAFAVMLWGFIKWRERTLKREKIALENKVELRTHELKEEKQKVESTLAELKATQEQLIQIEKKQAVSNERLRISRELHDEVGATLSSISIFSQAAIQKNESGNMTDSKNILERIGETSRDVMGELNDAVWLINPLNDNLQKIIQRISNYALPLCRTNNIHFEINAATSIENLALDVEKRKAIYLIIKEAVNNSLKYAAAKNLVIQFQQNQNALHISIKDDGKGFAENNSSSGNGLSNMQQRAKDVNGKIDFNSHEQKGTEIILEVPLTNIGD